MKFRVERDVLSEAVAWTARSLPSRPAAPVLAGLVFEAAEGEGRGHGSVTLSGFDYEVSSRAQIAADVTEPGRILIHGKLLADIAKSLPNRPVEFSTEGSKVLLSCGSSRFTLQTLPVEDYPALPTMPTATGAVTASGLAGAVSQVAIAAGRDDTIPMLTGIRVEIEGEKITLVATDRFRLAVRELQWKPEQDDMSATALIPSKVLSDTAKALTGGDWVSLALSSRRRRRGPDRLRVRRRRLRRGQGLAADDLPPAVRRVREVPLAVPERVQHHRDRRDRTVPGGRQARVPGGRPHLADQAGLHPGRGHPRGRRGRRGAGLRGHGRGPGRRGHLASRSTPPSCSTACR